MLVLGGFLLVRPVPRPSHTAPWMPERTVSLSTCVCPRFPDAWAIAWCGWEDREAMRAEAEAVGLSADRIDEARAWATAAIDSGIIGFPGTFRTLEGARACRDRFFPGDDDLHVIGFGLPRDLLDDFVREATAARSPPGFGPITKPLEAELVAERRPLPEAVERLGFEVLATDGVTNEVFAHTWLCNGLEVDVRDALGIVPNVHGLLATEEDARHAAPWIDRPEVGAEPGLWLPWALVRYR